MGQHPAGILRQQAEQFVLNGGQVQFLAAQPGTARRQVHPERPVLKDRPRALRSRHQRQPALGGPQPCQQLLHREGLGQVVVCAGVQRLDLVCILTAGAEHQDGQLRPGTHPADHLHPVDIRQAQVQQHDIRVMGRGHHQSGLSVCSGQKFVVVGTQCGGDQAAHRRIILHHQDQWFIHGYPPCFVAV